MDDAERNSNILRCRASPTGNSPSGQRGIFPYGSRDELENTCPVHASLRRSRKTFRLVTAVRTYLYATRARTDVVCVENRGAAATAITRRRPDNAIRRGRAVYYDYCPDAVHIRGMYTCAHDSSERYFLISRPSVRNVTNRRAVRVRNVTTARFAGERDKRFRPSHRAHIIVPVTPAVSYRSATGIFRTQSRGNHCRVFADRTFEGRQSPRPPVERSRVQFSRPPENT